MSFFMDRREFVKDSVVGAAIAAAGLGLMASGVSAMNTRMG